MIALTVSTMLPSPAIAAPTYLHCELSYLDGAIINLALDEQARKVTWSRGEASMVSDAAFTADAVTWKTYSGMTFRLSRVDLSLIRIDTTTDKSDKSQCLLVRARNRAF